MKRMTILALLATATVAQSVVAAVPAPVIPKGARIGAAGFATIRVAPPSPTGDVKPQRPTYRTVSEWYAQEHGLTIVEARKRLADQQALMPAFERLRVRLAQAEPDNYVDAKIVHRPDWGYVLYFKRDPEATLRKYHIHPRFQAARASSTRAEVEKLLAPWIKRFSDAKILSVYGVGAVNGPVELSIEVTAEEYRTFASPDGRFEIVVYRIPSRIAMPGQSSDSPGYFQLRDARTGRVLRECSVEMVQFVDRIEWSATNVDVRLLADWSLPK